VSKARCRIIPPWCRPLGSPDPTSQFRWQPDRLADARHDSQSPLLAATGSARLARRNWRSFQQNRPATDIRAPFKRHHLLAVSISGSGEERTQPGCRDSSNWTDRRTWAPVGSKSISERPVQRPDSEAVRELCYR